jgi:hypothetical protein
MDAAIAFEFFEARKIMDRSIERRVVRRRRAARARWIPDLSRDVLDGDLHLQHTTGAFAFRSDARLPPPRAARTPRSRGIFLRATEPPKKQGTWRKPDKSIIGLAVAVVAIASALIVGAPTAIMGAVVNANPGPAIVGAASVPPAFIEVPTAR